MILLFWTSGDMSGFQSQSGQPYSCFAEAYLWCDTFAGVYSQHSGQSLSAGVARLKWETSDLAVRRANHSATVSSFTGMLSCYRPQSCGKVMFLRLSVILFTGGSVCPGGSLSRESLSEGSARVSVQRHPSVRWKSGRYASYWNAFLLWGFLGKITDLFSRAAAQLNYGG